MNPKYLPKSVPIKAPNSFSHSQYHRDIKVSVIATPSMFRWQQIWTASDFIEKGYGLRSKSVILLKVLEVLRHPMSVYIEIMNFTFDMELFHTSKHSKHASSLVN